jgi:hypothetical protein
MTIIRELRTRLGQPTWVDPGSKIARQPGRSATARARCSLCAATSAVFARSAFRLRPDLDQAADDHARTKREAIGVSAFP